MRRVSQTGPFDPDRRIDKLEIKKVLKRARLGACLSEREFQAAAGLAPADLPSTMTALPSARGWANLSTGIVL
jgi:hypothetical protein